MIMCPAGFCAGFSQEETVMTQKTVSAVLFLAVLFLMAAAPFLGK
jgi:hypothetical protein